MREQVELTFLIGYDLNSDGNVLAFEQAVIEAACKLCGGCAVIPTTGYWMSDGASHQQTFSGRLQEEHTLHIKLSCELDKEQRVYKTMKAVIAAQADWHKVDTDWVHVQRSTFTGMHFSAKKEQGSMSLAVYRDIISPGTRYARA